MASPADTRYGVEIARQYKLKSQLHGETLTSLEALGDKQLRALVRRVVDDDASQEKRCKLMQEKENYRIYEVLGDDADETLVTMKGVLLLQSSSCEEVMELLSAADERALYSELFGSTFVDSAVLHETSSSSSSFESASHASRASALSATPLTTSTAFHWLMLRDLSAHLPCRDFLFMRYNHTYASEDPASSQRIGWGASVWESVEFPTCQPIFKATVSRRNVFKKCGFIVEASDHSDATRVTFFVTTPQGHPTQQQADRQWLLKLAASVRHLPSAIVNHRIRLNHLVEKRNWITRDACAICSQSFSKVFKRQHHCRLCGCAVCSKCSSLRHQSAVRVCLSCINGEDTSALWGTVRMARKKLSSTSITASSVSSVKESWSSSAYTLSGDFSRGSDYSFGCTSSRTSALEDFLDNDTLSRSKLSISTLSAGSMSFSSANGSICGDEDDVTENTSFDYQLSYAKGNQWPDAPLPVDEQQRLKRIKTLNLSQQYAKENLKELLDLARTSISCGVAAVAVVSVSKILLATAVGLNGDQLPRDVGFEAHALMSKQPLVVLDTQNDERFAMNPLVSSLNIRFYIGLPLVTREGVVIGALSLGDTTARTKVNGSDIRSLQRIATRIVAKMDASAVETTTKKVSGMLLI